MNTSTKCNCCVAEQICKYKEAYKAGVEAVKQTMIPCEGGAWSSLVDYPHIEVNIRCPHMITESLLKR